MRDLPVTIVIPIKNEAANLPRCLSKLGDFAEVVVVDSGSTDNSLALAEQYGATIVPFVWDGQFPKKRNWMLRNHAFKTPWVLFLDADEQVTPAFVSELREAVRGDQYNGFWVTYHNYFMGRLLRHGDTLNKLPLVRLGCGEFEHIAEDAWSTLDMEVHEHLRIEGNVGHLKSPLIHSDFKGLDAYYERHNQYSSWEAARYLSLKRSDFNAMTGEQRLKYRLLGYTWFPLLYFLGAYFLKKGFLDGYPGFRMSIGKMFYFYQVNFKIAEQRALRRKTNRTAHDLPAQN